ncbi:KdsC family phosphatase [Fundidesulfovibrio terrae]|uniref:KdsC family phosphatase n=1 Tax=Fundidesulfovibrio terrae TaxID=2922866 RepID=UPI001FAFED94|nr:phenylphosphate carboxylase subunit delta [Fundidesulfovibrio terrae]
MRRPVRPGVNRRALASARGVRLLVLDVDGVLTDNAVFHDGAGPGLKRFGIQDGMGLKLCQHAGIDVAVISGLGNIQAQHRLRELGIREFHGGHLRKLPVLEELLSAKHLDLNEVAYMGDDWLDAQVMSRVGLAMAPVDAQPEILRLAAWVSKRPGGSGAVRDAVRFLLMAKGKLGALWRRWLV